MTAHILHLPFPPSENRANRAGRNKKTGKIQFYPDRTKTRFFSDADVLMMMQRPRWFVKGPFTYHLILNDQMRHGNSDGQNRQKYVLDYIQAIGLIENDKFAEGGSWSWGSCEHGSMLSIHPVSVALRSSEAQGQGEARDGTGTQQKRTAQSNC